MGKIIFVIAVIAGLFVTAYLKNDRSPAEQAAYDKKWNEEQAASEYHYTQGARDAQLCRDRGGVPSIESIGLSRYVKLLRCDMPCVGAR